MGILDQRVVFDAVQLVGAARIHAEHFEVLLVEFFHAAERRGLVWRQPTAERRYLGDGGRDGERPASEDADDPLGVVLEDARHADLEGAVRVDLQTGTDGGLEGTSKTVQVALRAGRLRRQDQALRTRRLAVLIVSRFVPPAKQGDGRLAPVLRYREDPLLGSQDDVEDDVKVLVDVPGHLALGPSRQAGHGLPALKRVGQAGLAQAPTLGESPELIQGALGADAEERPVAAPYLPVAVLAGTRLQHVDRLLHRSHQVV